jgi:hypothetical protein
MKVIINNINIYHVHDNSYHIDNRHNSSGNIFKPSDSKTEEAELSDFIAHVVVNDDKDNPLTKELEARLIQSKAELKELIDKLKYLKSD